MSAYLISKAAFGLTQLKKIYNYVADRYDLPSCVSIMPCGINLLTDSLLATNVTIEYPEEAYGALNRAAKNVAKYFQQLCEGKKHNIMMFHNIITDFEIELSAVERAGIKRYLAAPLMLAAICSILMPLSST
ncbi:MAG: hypothetical protein ABI370_06610 [Gammaproteobacteria bacterium]